MAIRQRQKVKFVGGSNTAVWDPETRRIVIDLVSTDTKGRQWQSYNGGPFVLLPSPDEPDERSDRRRPRTRARNR